MKQLQLHFNSTLENEPTPYRTYFGHGDYQRPFDGQTGTTLLPVWNIYQGTKFDGSSKINSHKDVADIMSSLESKQVELAFAVHVNKNQEPFIQFLAAGSKAGVLMDASLILAGAKLHDSKEIYLVHNHPSGNLQPSKQDLTLTDKIAGALEPLGIDVRHVILNTYKKEYTFIINDDWTSHSRPDQNDRTVTHTAHTFDEMEILDKPISNAITSSDDVAKVIQQLRFSALPKFGLLALSQSNHIIGNFFVDNLSLKNVTDIIAPLPTVRSVITYGNTEQEKEMVQLRKELKEVDFNLLDYVQVNSNANGVKGAYKSYADEGLLREVQKKYGTNSILSEPKKELKPWESKGLENDREIGKSIKF